MTAIPQKIAWKLNMGLGHNSRRNNNPVCCDADCGLEIESLKKVGGLRVLVQKILVETGKSVSPRKKPLGV
jgi:hypothetical protein